MLLVAASVVEGRETGGNDPDEELDVERSNHWKNFVGAVEKLRYGSILSLGDCVILGSQVLWKQR